MTFIFPLAFVNIPQGISLPKNIWFEYLIFADVVIFSSSIFVNNHCANSAENEVNYDKVQVMFLEASACLHPDKAQLYQTTFV